MRPVSRIQPAGEATVIGTAAELTQTASAVLDGTELYSITLGDQGRRHQVLLGGGGADSYAHKPTYHQNLVSSRISVTLLRKCWKIQNLHLCPEKRY